MAENETLPQATTTSAVEPVAPAPSEPTPVADSPAPAPAAPPPNRGPQGGRGGKKPARVPEAGSQRVRMIQPLQTGVGDFRTGTGFKLEELDQEIAAEMESAMGGMSSKDLLGTDTSREVRQQTQDGTGRKKGKILRIRGQDIFVDVPGGRGQGLLTMEQFPEGPPKEGDEIEFSIEGFDPENTLLILSRKGAAVHADWSNVAEGMTVEARILSTNKGGLSVDVNGIKGFMPISQIDMYRVDNAEQFVNLKLLCIVTEANVHEKNLVVSRRALLEKERAEAQAKLWEELQENQVRSGVVRNIKPFGAFVDLGGADALLPISELSWKRVKDPSEVVQIGQTVKVAILRLDRELKKITVTLKQLEPSPWDTITQNYYVGQLLQGKVTRTAQFGAFVEIEPGLEGLVPISEIARQRVWRVADFAPEGAEVTVRVLSIDPDQRRISLSIRQAVQEAPKVEDEDADEDEADEMPARPEKPRTTPLRGGTGSDWRSNLPS